MTQVLPRNHGIAAIYDSPEALRDALVALSSADIPADAVTVLARGDDATDVAEGLEPAPRAALAGGVLGAYAGLWGGLLLLAVPGFGPALVAGGAAAMAAEAVAAAAAGTGAGLGALLGAVSHARHVEHHRQLYEAALERGGWLLVVHGTDAEQQRAMDCLVRHPPAHLDRFLD